MDREVLRSEDRDRLAFEFDGFRVDPVRRVLCRDGEPVAITPKALSILLVLLEQPGEVVEKRELLARVWPGVFVSEANLTQNVSSLRKALGERANDNRYIVTVPGRGYSFGGEVRRVERAATPEIPLLAVASPPPGPEGGLPLPSRQEGAEEEGVSEAGGGGAGEGDGLKAEPLPPAAALPPPPPPRRRAALQAWGALLALLLAGAGVFGLSLLAGGIRVPPPGAGSPVRPAIAVLDVKSLSPREDTRWLETAFAEMLTAELAAGRSLRVIRSETVAQARSSLGIRSAELGPSELRRLHEALGVDLVVVGSYVPIRGKLRLDLRVLQVPGGETVASLAEVGLQQGLFEMVSQTGARLRKALGVAGLSARQLQETRALQPSNPGASRLYSEGLARLRAYDLAGALRFLQRAAAADPGSAVIHSALSQTWSFLGYDARAEEAARKALDLAGPLPRAERLAIEGRFYKVSEQWDKASAAYRSLWTFFPDDVVYGLRLVESLTYGGRGAEAAEAIAALRRLPPPAGQDPLIDLAEAKNARRLSDLATQRRAAEAAEAKGRKSGQTLVVSQALIFQGDALLATGKPREAVRLFQEAAELAEQAGYLWGTGMALANVAAGLQVLGDLQGAQRANEKALAIAERTGSAVGIAAQLYALGSLHQDRGRLAEALALFEQSRAGYVKLGDRLMEARLLNAAGAALLAQGELAAARRRFERAMELSRALGTHADEAQALHNLGGVLAAQGELAEARRHHLEAGSVLGQASDSGLAASALAAAAEAEARLGSVGAAWQRSAQALAARRASGDLLGTGRILGSHAWIAYQRGDLAASRSLAGEQLAIARRTGARPLAAWALQNLGRADFAAGRPAAARRSFAEALRLSSDLRQTLRAMEVRLDLAALALALGRSGEAALNARQAAAWYQARGMPGRAARASSLLAEALARQGQRKEARQAAEDARARLDGVEDHAVRAAAAVSLARFERAAGNPREAFGLLRQAVADVAGTGLAAAGLEARLALGEVQRALGDSAAEVTLAAVRKEAGERGFGRLAAGAGADAEESLHGSL